MKTVRKILPFILFVIFGIPFLLSHYLLSSSFIQLMLFKDTDLKENMLSSLLKITEQTSFVITIGKTQTNTSTKT